MKKNLSQLKENQDGAAVMEFTLLLPFLIMIVLGVLEFGRFLIDYQYIITGVRDATHYLARIEGSVTTAHQTTAQNLATTGNVNGGTLRVPYWNAITVNVAAVANPIDPLTGELTYRNAAGSLETVTVTARITYSGLAFLPALGLEPFVYTVDHQERRIRG